MTMFFEWLRVRHPQYLMEQETPPATAAPPASAYADEDAANATFEALKKRREEIEKRMKDRQLKAQDRDTAWENTLGYTKEEILLQKTIIPRVMIRNAQFDYKKWNADFKKLQGHTPGGKNSNFITDKELFNEPVRMLVVTDLAFDRQGKEEAYPVIDKNSSKTVVLPKRNFSEMPTPETDGKLTPYGENELVRALRYTTQSKGQVDERNFTPEDMTPGYRSVATLPDGKVNPSHKKYYNDPKEMSVRLAAIKNYMSKESLEKIALLSVDNKFASKELVDFLPDDERDILDNVFNHVKWWQKFVAAKDYNKSARDNAWHALNELLNNLKKKNRDIQEILDYYNTLSDTDKVDYMSVLTFHYNNVAQNKSQYNQNAVT